jgi:hypothetical protein
MRFIIDIHTYDKKKLINRLKRLKWVESVEDGGEYWQDRECSQVWLTTNRTEKEIDDWLYKYSHVDYIGVVERT